MKFPKKNHLSVFIVFGIMAANAIAQPISRIGIRSVDGVAEFYDRGSGETFVVRGANFLDLAERQDRLFSPRFYDSGKVTSALQQMREQGYNTVRVFVDNCGSDCIGDPAGGLSAAFLDNIADFLQLAKAHKIYVILTSNDLPKRGGYVPQVEAQCCTTFDGYMNAQYLSPVGFAVYKNYWTEIVEGLIERDAPLDIILAYALRNEQFFFGDKPPLSLNSGMVTTANGKTYDMSLPEQKRKMVLEGLDFWIAEISQSIRNLDPEALFTIGFFAPDTPHAWRKDGRLVDITNVLSNPAIDFLDLHLYPGPGGLTMAQYVENFGISGFEAKPLVLGEFGGFKFVFRTPQAAARGVQDWQIASCDYGFDGWLHWHWQGTDDAEVWTGTEAGGAINKVLSVTGRPDPCMAGSFDFFEDNLALHKPVTASSSLPDQPAEHAVDGWMNTNWGAGAHPPQWIEIDLESPVNIAILRLAVEQFPAGNTRHRIWGKTNSGDPYNLLHEFSGFTQSGDILQQTAGPSWSNVRFIKVETVESPSWVSWSEIEILSSLPTSIELPEVKPAIDGFGLSQNYPNPFNPNTTIMFWLERRSHVTLAIYDLLGRSVIKLVDSVLNPGSHNVVWNGKNAKGRQVKSGVYFYKVTIGGLSETKKLLLVR
ncbi:MAG: T9SS type A sorting domain-containing protein [candidate division KSB1 bacterium]|nr:T9SS type A sorting domain-containing protein [candidate division KSB1 bacterium]